MRRLARWGQGPTTFSHIRSRFSRSFGGVDIGRGRASLARIGRSSVSPDKDKHSVAARPLSPLAGPIDEGVCIVRSPSPPIIQKIKPNTPSYQNLWLREP